MGVRLSIGFASLCSVAVFACGARSQLQATGGLPDSGVGPGGDVNVSVDAGANPVPTSTPPAQERVCEPGQTQACTGTGGCQGFLSCNAEGTRFSSCSCDSVGDDTGDTPDAGPGNPGPDATGGDTGGPGRVLYTRCSTLGDLDCSSQNPKVRLLCDGMTWNPTGVCSGASVCDTAPGPNHGLCTASDAGMALAPPSEDPGGTGVVLYTHCHILGGQDCSSQDPKIQVLCDGQTWGPIGSCTGTMICDTQPGPDQGLCKGP